MQAEDGRIQAVQELRRITKRNGTVFVAFRSRINHVLYSLLQPQHWKPNDNMEAITHFLNTGVFNHADQGRFTGAYFFKIEEICPFMEAQGFETVELIGSTNLATLFTEEQWKYWRTSDEEYAKLIQLLIQTAKEPNLLGMSSHLLYIGRRK